MIQIQSKLKINDNTGIKLGKCIKIYNHKWGTVGHTVLMSIKKLNLNITNKIKISKGDLFKALIVHTKYSKKSTIGNNIQFDQNCAIILDNQSKPLGTRIFGPLTSELRKIKKFKILSLSSTIL